jgi:hypothetical protein
MLSRAHQNEVDVAMGLLRGRGSRRGAFVDTTEAFAANRPGRPSPREPRRPLVDFDSRDLLVGTLLRRTFNGVEHVVYVVPGPADAPPSWLARGWGRYVYRGERYKSLTSIARLVVGAGDVRISGNRFFGLRRRRDRWFDDGLRWAEGGQWPATLYAPALAPDCRLQRAHVPGHGGTP